MLEKQNENSFLTAIKQNNRPNLKNKSRQLISQVKILLVIDLNHLYY